MDKLVCGAEYIDWNSKEEIIYIRGYALIRGKNIDKDYKVKKSLFIYNDERKFIMPAKNELRIEITEKYKDDDTNYVASLNEVVEALLALGYTEKEAEIALKKVNKEESVENIIKSCLKVLMG